MKAVKIIVAIVIVAALLGGGIFWMTKQKKDSDSSLESKMSAVERTEYLFDFTIPSKSKILDDYFTETGGTVYVVKLEVTDDKLDKVTASCKECDFDSAFEKVQDVSWWSLSKDSVEKSYVSTVSGKESKVHMFVTPAETADRMWVYMLYK